MELKRRDGCFTASTFRGPDGIIGTGPGTQRKKCRSGNCVRCWPNTGACCEVATDGMHHGLQELAVRQAHGVDSGIHFRQDDAIAGALPNCGYRKVPANNPILAACLCIRLEMCCVEPASLSAHCCERLTTWQGGGGESHRACHCWSFAAGAYRAGDREMQRFSGGFSTTRQVS